MATLNYWWVTRPKRKLNSIPEVLAAFSNVALSVRWSASRNVHILFEEELERDGLKRVGERRDHSGSGGRTYQAWLSSLGLIFIQESTGTPFLTLAGEAILSGKSPVEILKNQVLKYQFPSPFGIKTHVSEKFKVHPFIFLLRLLSDSRIEYLTEEEIAKVVMTEGINDSERCFEYVVERLLAFRESGDKSLPGDFIVTHAPSTGRVNLNHPYSHLNDTANTMVNWLEYTQLIFRDEGKMMISPEKNEEVNRILSQKLSFIDRPEDHEFFQRKYGLDPWHQKDTRNLLNTGTVSSKLIDMQRIRQAFIAFSMHRPIAQIGADIVSEIALQTGTDKVLVETVLYKEYPHGAIGGFLSRYYEMAFKGRDEAVDFEIATTSIFKDILGYNAIHLGQTGSKSAPDILLISDDDGYQAIIDNKAYSKYSISGDHHNRMVHNYIENVSNYSDSQYPIGFFSYIAGGFINTIDRQIQAEVDECHVCGSGITVGTFIKLLERHNQKNYSHSELRELFSLNRQILLSDIR
ncbi:restriction endonuclease FokI C-terminal domain-containing protein [uncultured Ruminobacter sp.]|uniref:restriction endonuclease FokI C-terminal domain-containing protein n=1 Tax=uncultured Ruminobacter sp. TaxID=538947 RepID=UPI0025D23475|nr:restriction endonuclease FokI C-terminal domain-containing protein [uncultured Ruminobacter sp.]